MANKYHRVEEMRGAQIAKNFLSDTLKKKKKRSVNPKW